MPLLRLMALKLGLWALWVRLLCSMAEPEWLGTLNFDTASMAVRDILESAKDYSKILKDEGAELIVAITHL